METFFNYFQAIVACVTPIIVAWFAYKAAKSEKQTKKYMEMQKEVETLNNSIKAKEKEEMKSQFENINSSISKLSQKMNEIEKRMQNFSNLDKKLENIIEISNSNFEFCSSLSSVITSIGNALDASDIIPTDQLRNDLRTHQENERKIINRVCKIVM
jgi:TolA-binding protein